MMEALEPEEIKETVKSAGMSGSGRIFAFFIHFFTNVLITRFLGSQVYGIFILGGTITSVGRIISMGGLQRGTLRFVSFYSGREKPEKVKEVIFSATGMVSVMSPFVAILLWFLAQPIALGVFHNESLIPAIQIFAISIPFGGLAAVWLNAVQGFKKIGHRVLIEDFLSPLIHLGFIGIVFLLGWRLLGLLVASVITSAMTCIIALFFLKRSLPTSGSAKSFCIDRELVNFSLPLLMVNFITFLLHRTDTLMLGYFETVSEVGIYSVAFRISLLILFPLTAFRPIFGPMISGFFGRNKIQKVEALFKTANIFSPFLGLILLWGHLP
jgi:O-antigen/teichoic acid export membrane protein